MTFDALDLIVLVLAITVLGHVPFFGGGCPHAGYFNLLGWFFEGMLDIFLASSRFRSSRFSGVAQYFFGSWVWVGIYRLLRFSGGCCKQACYWNGLPLHIGSVKVCAFGSLLELLRWRSRLFFLELLKYIPSHLCGLRLGGAYWA